MELWILAYLGRPVVSDMCSEGQHFDKTLSDQRDSAMLSASSRIMISVF